MNLVCCIKQVPDTADVKIDPETNTLIRSGIESITNPYDLVAVQAAVDLKERYGGTVTVISMGPPQAEHRSGRRCRSARTGPSCSRTGPSRAPIPLPRATPSPGQSTSSGRRVPSISSYAGNRPSTATPPRWGRALPPAWVHAIYLRHGDQAGRSGQAAA